MRVLLATDAFPPVCGGSGWSTYELARGLRARGHDVLIVQPRPRTAQGVRDTTYDEFRVVEFGKVADHMKAIGALYGCWCPLCRSRGILPSTITADQQDAGIGGGGRRSFRMEEGARRAPAGRLLLDVGDPVGELLEP